jgi:hypothetical protein
VRPPRPIVIAVVMLVLALVTLAGGVKGTGAEAAGYLFGSTAVPALIALGYTWWYRRRRGSGSQTP